MRASVWVVLACLAGPADLFAWEGRIVTTDGRPVSGATVTILGLRGEAITDANGEFAWQPDPTPPFEVLVVLGDGTYMKPVRVQRLDAGRQVIRVEGLVSEAITVSGSAPGIESTPAAGTTTLSGREVDLRQPANLVQAVENVAGVSQVSEGQAAVPRNNSEAVRFVYPHEDSHRFTVSWDLPDLAGFERANVTTFFGRSSQRTDQDRAATGTTARQIGSRAPGTGWPRSTITTRLRISSSATRPGPIRSSSATAERRGCAVSRSRRRRRRDAA